MEKPLVSIVIPVYQKEKYVEECITSILNQTYKNIELICIDDHSYDRSSLILKQMADIDPRITIISNSENKGAAVSRNIGIEISKGKYLSILDADDVYDSEFIEKAIWRCEQDKLDVLLYDFYVFNETSGKKMEKHMPLTFREILKDNDIFSNKDIEKFSYQMCTASGWTKIYKNEFIKNNNIKFQNISSANEALFNRLAVSCAERIGYMNCCWTSYRIGIENQISNLSKMHSLNYAKVGVALKRELISRKLYKNNMQSFNIYIFTSIISYIRFIDPENWLAYYSQIKKMLTEIIGNIEEAFPSTYYKYWYQDFMSLSCYDVVDKIANEYQYIFLYDKAKLKKIKEYIDSENSKTVLWGYGKNGKNFYQKCIEYDFHIDYVIDKYSIDGIALLPEVLENCNNNFVVLATSASLVEDILMQSGQLKNCVALIDIQSYLSYGIEFSKCLFKR